MENAKATDEEDFEQDSHLLRDASSGGTTRLKMAGGVVGRPWRVMAMKEGMRCRLKDCHLRVRGSEKVLGSGQAFDIDGRAAKVPR